MKNITIAILAIFALGAVYMVGQSNILHWHMMSWDKVSDQRAIATYTNGQLIIVCDEYARDSYIGETGANSSVSCVAISK